MNMICHPLSEPTMFTTLEGDQARGTQIQWHHLLSMCAASGGDQAQESWI